MEAPEARVAKGRLGRAVRAEGLMALDSAQLPGLWAAELASVASTQALQRDGWRDCEAGGSGRRGWARARNRLARPQVAALEARARMAGRAGSAYGELPMSR